MFLGSAASVKGGFGFCCLVTTSEEFQPKKERTPGRSLTLAEQGDHDEATGWATVFLRGLLPMPLICRITIVQCRGIPAKE
ncbi:hypothetical protein Nepgr_000034 [Nepenthes gracilis]|uniref:Uncharacterized protein n=1 Tax=Nepenthes gracilis TaxID=150966 RepID=A0AAD3P3W6_NEPGR|nr:hypothetical protein Nepgr_000034 [Nepenthes gracilis]